MVVLGYVIEVHEKGGILPRRIHEIFTHCLTQYPEETLKLHKNNFSCFYVSVQEQIFSNALRDAVSSQVPHWPTIRSLCAQEIIYQENSLAIVNILEHRKHHFMVTDIIQKCEAIEKLYQSINKLSQYGEKLTQEYPGCEDGLDTQRVAKQLKELSHQFVDLLFTGYDNLEKRKQINDKFKDILQLSYIKMGNHRALWKPVLINIAIAATALAFWLFLVKY